MPEINMPKLSDTMEEGTVLSWAKQDGDQVKKGEVVAEIETDKASFEIEADADGVLHIKVEPGQPVPVGAVIGSIGDGGAGPAEAATAKPDAEPDQGGDTGKEDEPAPARAQEKPADSDPQAVGKEVPAEPQTPQEPESAEKGRSAGGKGDPSPPGPGARVKASPLARRLAEEHGIDLAAISGSGPEGRIVKEDVMAAAERGAAPKASDRPSPSSPPRSEAARPRQGQTPARTREAMTRMQQTVARRMTQSKTTVPHFYVTSEARVDEAVRLRRQLRETVPGAERVTVTDMLVRACAIALRRYPDVNAAWVDEAIEPRESVNIGIAVAQPRGLIVPVIHDADRKDLIQLAIEGRQVVERARAGKPAAGDLEGGTFSISNLGMFGVDEFAAIINPPESAILAVGGIKDAAVVEDGKVVAGQVMRMTLSVDHRVFYGATAAQFLAEVKKLLENPVSLVMPPAQD